MEVSPQSTEPAREALDQALLKALASRLQVDYLEYRNVKVLHSQLADRKDLYVTFRKEILPEIEQNMQAIPRKAARDGAQGHQEWDWKVP